MSSLTDIDKRYLEKIFGMRDGYVLDYSDPTYGEFFARHNIHIHTSTYQTYGTSKAKKMRAFWEQEPDQIVAPILAEMLAAYEVDCKLHGRNFDKELFDQSKVIVARLGSNVSGVDCVRPDDIFLNQEFKIPKLDKLPIEPQIAEIIERRLREARAAQRVGAHLSVIVMCGSVLEGVLLGVARSKAEQFNRATASPKNTEGKVKPFREWTLAQFIDVACEAGFLSLDVKKFSHGLRDFRNYIHPYEQLVSGFSPDEHTAQVCLQVLKAALASLAGERQTNAY